VFLCVTNKYRKVTPSTHGDSQGLSIDDLSHHVIGAAMEVHSALGPGLLESAYQECLEAELKARGFIVEKQVPMPIRYKDVKLDHGCRMDLVVNDVLVLELKSKDSLIDVDFAQLLLPQTGRLSPRTSFEFQRTQAEERD
jgi:GxxExxY protein